MRPSPTHLLSLSVLALAGAILYASVQPARAAEERGTNCQTIQGLRMTAVIFDQLRSEGRTHFVAVDRQVCAW